MCACVGNNTPYICCVIHTPPTLTQVCFQIWLASSLLADALAVAAQSLVARNVAAGMPQAADAVVRRTCQLSALLGVSLSAVLWALQPIIPGLFTHDPIVVAQIRELLPFVLLTQPLNALAFTLDGVLYGVQGFAWAAKAMLLASGVTCTIMWVAVAQVLSVISAVAFVCLAALFHMKWFMCTIHHCLFRSPCRA